MKKYVRVINQDNKLCEVGEGTDVDFYTSIGMEEMEVEQAYNGDWYLLGYAPQMPLEIAKHNKLDELSSIKATKLLTLNYEGNDYQIDSDSKINISGKVSQIILATSSGQDTGAINWITKDNKIVSFSKEEFMAFGVAVATHTEAVIFKHDQLRTAVNNATSIDEIKAIAWVD